MPDHHLLGAYIRRFLLEHVVADRNLSRNTQRNYRDAIRVLLRFMTDRHRIDPADLTVEQVTVDVVREFLQYLEQERQNTAATLNQRVTVIHSLFRFIGRQVPELVERATQLQAVPCAGWFTPRCPISRKSKSTPCLPRPIADGDWGNATTPCCCFCTTPGRAPTKRRTSPGARSISAAQPPSVSSGKAERPVSVPYGTIPRRSSASASAIV
jgi:hypothetical protein